MTNSFVINGVTYKAKPFGYGLICDLEEFGVDLNSADKKPMSMIRAYFCLCANVSADEGAELIEKHIIGGGNLDSLQTAMMKEVESSSFFQSLTKATEETTPASQPAKKTSRANSK